MVLNDPSIYSFYLNYEDGLNLLLLNQVPEPRQRKGLQRQRSGTWSGFEIGLVDSIKNCDDKVANEENDITPVKLRSPSKLLAASESSENKMRAESKHFSLASSPKVI